VSAATDSDSPTPFASSTIAHLGPHGTFTEEALLTQPDLAAATRLLRASNTEVLNAVENGETDFGFAPIENSIEGTVNATIDTLAFSSSLLIQREIDLPIAMQLFGHKDSAPSSLKQVLSHPHALGQCRLWLRDNLPGVETVATNSTADAVRMVADEGNPEMAAIGNALAGRLQNLATLATNIEDNAGNITRFVLVAQQGVPQPTGHDKTSVVMFQRNDRPGSLLSMLQEFAARSINLTKLESRPTKQAIGDYCFIMDLQGHIADELVADCLKNIRAKAADIKFLGSYPAVGATAHQVRADASEAWRSAEDWIAELRASMY